jgi:hypothetical protein
VGEIQVSHQDMRGFVRAGPGVVKKQKEKVIASSLPVLEVGGREESIDFGLLKYETGV